MFITASLIHALPVSDRRMLDRKEAASYVGVSVTYFDSLVSKNQMPAPVLLGRRKVWDRRDLDQAIDRAKTNTFGDSSVPGGWDSVLS